MGIDRTLRFSYEFTGDGLPLVLVANFPGLDAEMTIPELEAMAAQLQAAANHARSLQAPKRRATSRR